MPKPNRYQANGAPVPNGTVMGRYIMRNGHWVDVESPLGRHAVNSKGLKHTHSVPKTAAKAALWVMGIWAIIMLGLIAHAAFKAHT